MKLVSSILGVLTMLVLSVSYGQSKDVLATVGDKKITLEDFNKKYSDVVSKSMNPPSKQQFLEDLVRYEVGLLEAEKKNISKDPVFQDRFKQEMYKVLLEKELGNKVQKIQVSDKEMEAYYKKNPEIRLSHILIEVRPSATAEQRAEAKKRADEIYEKEVKPSKRPFEELVRLFSDDPLSKQTGGDVGWQSRQTLVPVLYDTIYQMKVGEIKGVIDTKYGFHIVKVTGRRSYENADKRAVRTAVFDEKRRHVFNEYFDQAKKGYKISTNPKLIE